MSKIQVSLLVLAVAFVMIPDEASARIFRRYSRVSYAPSTTTTYRSAPATSSVPVANASLSHADVSTAQGVAVLMARYNRVGHFGGNRGYEGCGCGSTPQAAYSICCYANSGMTTVDVGYARGSNGMWYCCRRYR